MILFLTFLAGTFHQQQKQYFHIQIYNISALFPIIETTGRCVICIKTALYIFFQLFTKPRCLSFFLFLIQFLIVARTSSKAEEIFLMNPCTVISYQNSNVTRARFLCSTCISFHLLAVESASVILGYVAHFAHTQGRNRMQVKVSKSLFLFNNLVLTFLVGWTHCFVLNWDFNIQLVKISVTEC